jgi:D-3-phosphoglycerate dehydrogenase
MHNINILAQYLKTNDEIGYVVLDIDKRLSNQALQLLKEVRQTIKTRLLY